MKFNLDKKIKSTDGSFFNFSDQTTGMPVFTSMATVTGNLLSSEKSKDFKDALKNHELSVMIYGGKDFDVEEADLKRILDVLEKSNISDFMK